MLHIADAIERSVVLPADPASVWERSFASPAALASWFPELIEGDWSVGGVIYLVWGEHRCEARLTEFDPERALAYQWHPGEAYLLDSYPESELTTVRFTLTAVEGGTEVKLVESGFAAIAESRREWAFGQNSGGWDEELAKLPRGY